MASIELRLLVLFICFCCCCCWRAVNRGCHISCPIGENTVLEPRCTLIDDRRSTHCEIIVTTPVHYYVGLRRYPRYTLLPYFGHLTLSVDLGPKILSLTIHNNIGDRLVLGGSASRNSVMRVLIYSKSAFIHNDLFSLMPNLTRLEIKDSVKFRNFPPFSRFNRELAFVYIRPYTIRGVRVSTLARWRISDLPNLKHLDLEAGPFCNLLEDSLSGLTALTSLSLGAFHIPTPVTTLSPLVGLKHLAYWNSGLTDISFLEQASFRKNLEWLDLSGNQIMEIGIHSFKELESVTGININFNPITHLSSRMFEHLPKLRSLFIIGLPLHCTNCLKWISIVKQKYKINFGVPGPRCATPIQHYYKLVTDPSIHDSCTQELSYKCFDPTVSCPNGTHCQDTLDSYMCVCKEVDHLFIETRNACVSLEDLAIKQPPPSTQVISHSQYATSSLHMTSSQHLVPTPHPASCPTPSAPACPTPPKCPACNCQIQSTEYPRSTTTTGSIPDIN